MRVRCARCGCYVRASGTGWVRIDERVINYTTITDNDGVPSLRVAPCKRCLHEAKMR